MAQDNDNNYQDELDVYQAAWAIGKQRGVDAPLESGKLAKLLESGRLSWNVLGEKERSGLEKDEAYSKSVEKWRNESGSNVEGKGEAKSKGGSKANLSESDIRRRFEIAKEVTLQLYDGIEGDFEDVVSKEKWDGYSDEEKKAMRFNFFRLQYGTSPQFFANDLFRALVGR